MTVADVLNGAADLIERDGWCQNTSHGAGGTRCAVAAIRDARPLPVGVYTGALEWFERTLGCPSAALWNDAPGRTKTEVVAALRAAAERARA